MRIPIYQVDAFTNEVFHGNPAAVCPLDRWLDDATLQAIAAENNLSETAFFLRGDGAAVAPDHVYPLRWFTPKIELDLAGHPTLATAFVIFRDFEPDADVLRFDTSGGRLEVRRDGERLSMDFPSRPAAPCPWPDRLVEGLGRRPREVWCGRDFMAVYEREADVRALAPRMDLVAEAATHGVIVTAPGERVDFVSRFFAPSVGIAEDPVTGSAHCSLAPYWAERLGKTKLHARQISARGGELFLECRGERVLIAGQAVFFMQGVIVL